MDKETIKLSIIIPVYNEKDSILSVIERVKSVNVRKEIIIVDDGSSDGTTEILQGVNDNDIRIFYQPINMGKGIAIRIGLFYVSGDYTIIQDADLEYNPEDYLIMLKPAIEKGARVVYGRRVFDNGKIKHFRYLWGGKLVTILTNLLYGTGISDEPTCYKLFKTDIIKKIKLNCIGFEFCPEITAKIAKNGIKITEVPISYYPRGMDDGKKIRWFDGIKAIYVLFKYKFTN